MTVKQVFEEAYRAQHRNEIAKRKVWLSLDEHLKDTFCERLFGGELQGWLISFDDEARGIKMTAYKAAENDPAKKVIVTINDDWPVDDKRVVIKGEIDGTRYVLEQSHLPMAVDAAPYQTLIDKVARSIATGCAIVDGRNGA